MAISLLFPFAVYLSPYFFGCFNKFHLPLLVFVLKYNLNKSYRNSAVNYAQQQRASYMVITKGTYEKASLNNFHFISIYNILC
ncbi:MAG: hypothetical protein P9X22_01585, partial [Candidatus Zapsychrus exili]|nr:hypothetical protein [Candidatus Zapsychrus exili]